MIPLAPSGRVRDLPVFYPLLDLLVDDGFEGVGAAVLAAINGTGVAGMQENDGLGKGAERVSGNGLVAADRVEQPLVPRQLLIGTVAPLCQWRSVAFRRQLGPRGRARQWKPRDPDAERRKQVSLDPL